jgi:NADPH-dependent ferric siderophore reductase
MTHDSKPDIHERPRQRPPLRSWILRVVDGFDVEPNMRRVVMTADDIGEFAYEPGQAIVLMIPGPDGGTGRRDYTIRGMDRLAGTISVDFVLHGDTPAPHGRGKRGPAIRSRREAPAAAPSCARARTGIS